MIARLPLLLVSALASSLAFSQTHFYVHSIAVDPAAPTTTDAITLAVEGSLSSTGAYIVSASHMLMGNTVHITMHAADPGGSDVLVPHTETFELGNLEAGTYTVLIDGTATADLAPDPDHTFIVGEGDPCAALTLQHVLYEAFSDTAVEVFVLNPSFAMFSYPGFILFDAEGDTVAKEVVNFFGIGTESLHVLPIHPDADLTSPVFNGHLELWTGFYEELACSFDLSMDLCPDTCMMLMPSVQNAGGALSIGTYNWTIDNVAGLVASGTLTMTAETQFNMDTLCLEPGRYWMHCTPQDEPTGGQPRFGVSRPSYFGGPSEPLLWNGPNELEFDWYLPCAGIVEGLPEIEGRGQLELTVTDGSLALHRRDRLPLGAVEVLDARGRVLFQGTAAGDRLTVGTASWSAGVVLVRAAGEAHRTTIVR